MPMGGGFRASMIYPKPNRQYDKDRMTEDGVFEQYSRLGPDRKPYVSIRRTRR